MDTLFDTLIRDLGPANVLTGSAAVDQAHSPWTRLGEPLAVVRPGSTAEVAAVLRAANAAGAAVVPWGGKTGLVDGAMADGAIALSLDRMTAIETIDTDQSTMTVQAGCGLETACRAADDAGLFLPLDFGARGSATIGGAVSTNAGGNRVLRFGMARDMVLGLEAVLADGTVLTSLNGLIKNNAGYDLKQLFIGSEGTLGVVTRAVLRLRPKPASQDTALLAVDSFDALPRVLRRLEAELGGQLSAFEVMWPQFYDLVTTPPATGRPILPVGHGFYVLVETLGADPIADSARFEGVLAGVLGEGLVVDAAIAQSGAERARMWALRDDVAQTARNGPIQTFDVSAPLAGMESYLAEVHAMLDRALPNATLTVFGHLGDGNLHLIVGGVDVGRREAVEAIVYAPLAARHGSVSAEHGIGLQKRAWLGFSRSPEEIALMGLLKRTLDPNGILNPAKVLADAGKA